MTWHSFIADRFVVGVVAIWLLQAMMSTGFVSSLIDGWQTRRFKRRHAKHELRKLTRASRHFASKHSQPLIPVYQALVNQFRS
jgi:hypothetical protein